MVSIELSPEDAEWFASHPRVDGPMFRDAGQRGRLVSACVEALEIDRQIAESDAEMLPPATLPELGFSHIAECRRCRQPITIAKWTHVTTGGFPSGNEANADHNPMPDPTTIEPWGGE